MKINFKIPAGTTIWYHTAGKRFNINVDFETKVTDKSVTFTLEDLWFIPEGPARVGELARFPIPSVILDDTKGETWPRDIQKSLGFKLPSNKLNIDYIIARFSDVTWEILRDKDDPLPTPSDASKIIRSMNQRGHGHYFPGQLPTT